MRADETTEPEAAAPVRHQQLGRYIILGKLGAGGMGVVHEAYDPELDRRVALKILSGVRSGVSAQGRLLREGQALARINHANVVQIYDVGVDQGQVFIAMERIHGVTLRTWLASASRSLAEILRVFIAAGRGLAEAHAAGIIHRDFKPENALIDATGTLRIVDFGLARSFADELARTPEGLETAPSLGLPVTQFGALVGTLAYMAPEQLAGERVDVGVDIFAFSVSLFEALYGARPFTGETASELLASIKKGPTPRAPKRVPPELHALIVRGLAASPADRWPNIAALTERLQALARPSRRRAAAVVLLAGAVGVGTYAALPSAPPPCSGVAREIADTWDPSVATSLGEVLRAGESGFVAATWRRVEPQLASYAERWSEARIGVCQAREDGAVSERLHDLEVACLASRREALAATIAVIRRRGPSLADELETMVEGLPELASCRDPARVQIRWAPPDDPAAAARVTALEQRLVDAEASMSGGDVDRAEALLEAITAELGGLTMPALAAELARVEGQLAGRLGRTEAVFAAERRRFAAALTIGDHESAALAAAELVRSGAGEPPDPGIARTWQTVAESLLAGPGAHTSTRATLDARVGEALLVLGDLESALGVFEQGLALAREDAGVPWSLRVSLLKHVLAISTMLGRYDGHTALTDELLALTADNRADGHPDQIHARLAVVQGLLMNGELARAAAIVDEAAAIVARGGLVRRDLSFEIAAMRTQMAGMRGDLTGLDAAATEALALADSPADRLRVHGYVGTTYHNAGQVERAIEAFAAGLAATPDAVGPLLMRRIELQGMLGRAYVDAGRLDEAEATLLAVLKNMSSGTDGENFIAIEARTGLGEVLLRRGKLAEARGEFEATLAALAGREFPPGYVGNIHYGLARALWPADRARAREHAALAIRDFSPLPEARGAVAEIEAWLAEHPAR